MRRGRDADLGDVMPLVVTAPLTLRERVVEQLKFAVLTGEFTLDRTYTVPEFAKQFGVSATPMREAVLDLVKESLLFTVPGRGFRIQADPFDVVMSVAQARNLIEIPVSIDAAAFIEPADYTALTAMAEAMLGFAAVDDVRAYLRTDLEFHRLAIERHPNALLVTMVEYLRARARVHLLPLLGRPGMFMEPAREHLALIDALRSGDATAIGEVVNSHIHRVVHYCRQGITPG